MDDLNPQMQNPNIPPMTAPQSPMGQAPQMPYSAPKKKQSPVFWIIILIAVAVAGVAWWYIGNMVPAELVTEQPQINQEAREDALIGNEIQDADLGDIDKEFESIDQDLNSL